MPSHRRVEICAVVMLCNPVWWGCSQQDSGPTDPPPFLIPIPPAPASTEPPAGEDVTVPPDDDRLLLSTGGCRLKTYRFEGEGASMSGGWFDNLLGERCNFGRDPRGELRCFPLDRAIVTSVVYTDAGCTLAAAILTRTACAPPRFLLREYGDVCPLGNRLFRRGRDVAKEAALFAKSAAGTCAAAPALKPGQDAYEVGDEIPAADLVLERLWQPPTTERLAPVFMETADGARTAFSLHDTVGDFDCVLAPAADGVTRCLPLSAVSLSSASFSDEGCTARAGQGGSPACPDVPFARQAIGACPPRVAIHRGGPKVAVFSKQGGVCSRGGGDGYALGGEVAADAFAAGQRVLHPGPGRLRMRMNRSPIGSQRGGVSKDLGLGIDCVAAPAADGTVRCLPNDTADATAHFADAACTQRLGRAAATACAVTHAQVNEATSCPARRRIFGLGARHDGPVFTLGADGSCQAAPPGGDWLYFAVGAEVAPAAFVELAPVLR